MSDALLDFETLKRKGDCKNAPQVVAWLMREQYNTKVEIFDSVR